MTNDLLWQEFWSLATTKKAWSLALFGRQDLFYMEGIKAGKS